MSSFLRKPYRNFLENKRENFLDLLFLIGILIFAFLITYRSGERGFFAFDQSIVFDGSYRVVTGQTPYKDFLIPFGPMTFWLQAIFFKIFGISYFVYICGAAIINVFVAAESFFLIRLLFPKPKLLAYFAGILTSVWFYPPFGTPWPEQTAFFFSLTALVMTVGGLLSKRIPATWKQTLFFGAGLLAFGAFISKQNAGVFILPVCASLFSLLNQGEVRRAIRALTFFCLGCLAGLLFFGAWLVVRSDPALFWKYFVEIPAAEVGGVSVCLPDWDSG
jgi:4-amino-4-deoxy-L-arabinose transferase-like glycosyltransferase